VMIMTIRKQLVIIIISLISVTYIDNYFKSYISEQYDDNVNSIKIFSEDVLMDKSSISMRTQVELKILFMIL